MSLEAIKELRERTNVGLGECKSALDEAGGNIDQAIEVLQKRGTLRAAARASRVATDGQVYSYVHNGGKLAVIVEVNCETDFAAKSPAFLTFCEQVAMQIAALGPKWLTQDDISSEEMSRQRFIFLHQLPGMTKEKFGQLMTDNSPEFTKLIRILDGKTKKWTSEVCLMEQESVVVPKRTIEQLRTDLVAVLGENINVRRFIRWELGDGFEKKQDPKDQTQVC